MKLETVRWEAALNALAARRRAEDTPAVRRQIAEASSMSALFESDMEVAAGRVAEAIDLEPLNPLHRVRLALLSLRAGRYQRAIDILDALPVELRDEPLIPYLRAVATLRQGDSKRATTMASDILVARPDHAPAAFLQAEAHLRVQIKGLERRMPQPPYDLRHAAAWADLLIKLVLARPVEGTKLAKGYLDRGAVPKGSREAALVQQALTWASAAAEPLSEQLALLPPGSRAEQIALLLFDERIQTGGNKARVEALRRLHRLMPERKAIRRLYVAALTQHAVEEAGRERYTAALRAVEACLRLEPHETIHHQNRAALFTLMLESDAYHQGWQDLERHHYRLALLGWLSRDAALTMARPHRMFAQQARLTPDAPGRPRLGIFVQEKRGGDSSGPADLTVHQTRIDADPEQLRQWIHHRRAELVFLHLSLGESADRALLYPPDPAVARARADGLALAAESLATLVPEEGARLAELLAARWRAAASRAATRYGLPPEDREARALSLAHLETLADLALLCLQWHPPGRRPEIVEEVIDFLRAEAPFFDDALLFTMLSERETTPSCRLLSDITRAMLQRLEQPASLSQTERSRVIHSLLAKLLVKLALEQPDRSPIAIERAIDLLDRARQADPQSADVEFWAARMLTIGEFYDEAREALARFHRLSAGDRQSYRTEAEELQRILDKKKKDGVQGQQRTGAPVRTEEASHDNRATHLEALEADIERYPASIQLHEDLVHALGSTGNLDEALRWAEHAVARCLSRESQLRARALHVETLALQALSPAHQAAVKLYAAGTHAPLLNALEASPDAGERPYPVEYILGTCLLAAKRPEDAQRAFVRALRCCSKQMHLAVLRPLAFDVEQALLKRARNAVDDALGEGRIGDAIREVGETWPRLSAQESCLMLLARVQLAAVVAAIGSGSDPVPLPDLPVTADWAERFAGILNSPDPLGRARDLTKLAAELYEPSAKEAEAILRRVEALETQLAVAAAVNRAGAALRSSRPAEALSALDAVRETGEREAPWIRMRVLVLLALDRFDEADALACELSTLRDHAARELCEQYPVLAVRRRIAAVNRLLRAGDTAGAETLLATTQPADPEQVLEVAYCRAFARALEARQRFDQGDDEQGRQALAQALAATEPHIKLARERKHERLIELHGKLDEELADRMEGRR